MLVRETLTFNQYWCDPRFRSKKPNLQGSKKQAFGDNIYFKDPKTNEWHQENSHHSLADGSPNCANIEHDTTADRVLISDDFVYWGGSGPAIPPSLCDELCKSGPGHKSKCFSEEFKANVVAWLRSQDAWGYVAPPCDWKR